MKRFGAILFWLGVLITVVSVGLIAFAGFRVAGAAGDIQTAVDESIAMPGGSSTVQLQQGQERTIYEQTESEIPQASCEASDPDGGGVDITQDSARSGSFGDLSFTTVGSFTAEQAGPYTVTCTGATTLIGPSLDIGALGLGALGVVGGILGAGLGLFMVICGAILWFVGRSRTNTASASSYEGTAPPGGTYPPPPRPRDY